MLPISSPSCLPPRRRGAPRGNKNALGHGAPRGNRNGVGHGAPRGNRNARKFGIYSREFTRPMPQPPGVSVLEALELEIHRIRLYIRDNLASVSLGRSEVGSHLALLRAVTIAVGRISSLHRQILAIQTLRAICVPLCPDRFVFLESQKSVHNSPFLSQNWQPAQLLTFDLRLPLSIAPPLGTVHGLPSTVHRP